MRLKQLDEGVRYGSKQRNEVLSSLNDFGFGFEIEMNPPDGYDENEGSDRDESVKESVYDRVYESEEFTVDSSDFDTLAWHVIASIGSLAKISDAFSSEPTKDMKTIFNSSNIEDMKTLTNDRSTMDMYPVEYVHALVETLDSLVEDVSMKERLAELLDLSYSQTPIDRFDVIGSLIRTGDVDPEFYEDMKQSDIEKLADTYLQLTDALYNDFLKLIPDDIYSGSTLKPLAELTDSQKDELLQAYEDEDFAFSFNKALDDITNSPIYHESMDFSVLSDGDKRNVIEIMFEMKGEDTLSNLLKSINLSYEEEMDVFDSLYYERDIIGSIIEEFEEAYDENASIGNLEEFFDNKILPSLTNEAQAFSYRTEKEYDDQLEIILDDPVHGDEIVTAFKTMYEIIEKLEGYGFETRDNSGLHMSISYKGGTNDFNKYKFIVLSHVYDLVQGNNNMVRRFVNDVYTLVEENLPEFVDDLASNAMEDDPTAMGLLVIDYVEDHLNLTKHMPSIDAKYHGINFNGYDIYDGRVELRFFGGEGYENKYDEYLDIILRMMYILKVSSDNSHNNEYMKTVVRTVNKILKKSKYKMDLNEIVARAKYVKKLTKSLGYDIDSGREINRIIDDFREVVDKNQNIDNYMLISKAYEKMSLSEFINNVFIQDDIIKALEAYKKAIK